MTSKSKPKKEAKLNAKQRTFVEEYLVDLNATQAAIRAGYSKHTASEMGYENLNKPQIQTALQAAMEKRSKRTEITADYVLDTIQDTVERCRQARPVVDKAGKQIMIENADGDIVPAYVFDAGNVLKGTDQLGRHLKMFTDKREIDATFSVTIGDKDAGSL